MKWAMADIHYEGPRIDQGTFPGEIILHRGP